jgi:hypothetical protein
MKKPYLKDEWIMWPSADLKPATRADKRKMLKGRPHEVTYLVGYEYNGGTTFGDRWARGYKVPPPVVPKGWRLVNIGVGLQLNCHPPYATVACVPIEENRT